MDTYIRQCELKNRLVSIKKIAKSCAVFINTVLKLSKTFSNYMYFDELSSTSDNTSKICKRPITRHIEYFYSMANKSLESHFFLKYLLLVNSLINS